MNIIIIIIIIIMTQHQSPDLDLTSLRPIVQRCVAGPPGNYFGLKFSSYVLVHTQFGYETKILAVVLLWL